jgi:uncharacterized protein YggE
VRGRGGVWPDSPIRPQAGISEAAASRRRRVASISSPSEVTTVNNSVMSVARAVLLSLPAWATSLAQQPARSISVTGQAEVRVTPSLVNIVFGVETLNKALTAAKEENDRRVKAVVQSTQALGVAAKDIQTDYIQVEPRYDDLTSGTVLRHYTVRKTIAVTLNDVSKFERCLSGALDAGASHVIGVQFLTADLRKYRDEARARAIQAAREKAVALARELNARVGKAISIQEYGSGGPWNSYNSAWSGGRFSGSGMNQVSIQGSPDSGDLLGEAIALGRIGITASVNVSFELEPL